ncbi:heterokaryon incompatibility protein-domain-containing protein [Collybia nuda]|uniref:Heterokaryon incompatibility protein-domain-containing protein n=1 Tax=Collybia nuda TaxID=64659 RepID=A0A9P6CI41_9AGAR|nr:heterokaryon incompatibility protein-domain-containing protein [Collybia nuda]
MEQTAGNTAQPVSPSNTSCDLIGSDIDSIEDYTETTRSLVCDDCWKNLFAHDSFRKAWDGQFRDVPFFEVKSHEDIVFSYVTTIDQINRSKEEGCSWCTMLSTPPHTFWSSSAFRIAFRPALYCDGTLLGAQRMTVWVGQGARPKELFSYPIYTKLRDPCANEVVARDRALQMKSTRTVKLALDCIHDCIANHATCPKPINSFFPTRVIDCTNPMKPKLLVSLAPIREPYVVLSYVWGEGQPYKTTTINIEDYQRGINPIFLPQTIKDAIWTTRACGQRYLWVDALCIIQNSRQDQNREIGQIPNIFADAYFTIIAARSPGVSEGFLHDCTPPSVSITRLPFRCQSGSANIGAFFVEHDNIGKYDEGPDTTDPIHKRAWCLEERLLSARSLIYTSTTLRFHCQLLTVNVGAAARESHDLATHRLAIDWAPSPEDPRPSSPSSDAMFHYNRSTTLWDNIIMNYSKRYVTNEDDKLVALAGVAYRFGERWKKEPSSMYLAGLWHDNLQHDLLWHKKADDLYPRSTLYRAPSWSWASVDGCVEGTKMYPKEWGLYELIDCNLELVSKDLPFGGIASGSLTMNAKLIQASWRASGLYASNPLAVGGESKLYFAWRDTTEEIGERVWILPLCWRAKAEELAGLVLLPNDREGFYRRVGCFQDGACAWISKDDIEKLDSHKITIL